jgi:uncharacterized protein YndB with AHSA1/START domain
MTKHKFTTEFEINASKKMLFPYLNTASGLAQWFADDVNIGPEKIWTFDWDNEQHKARLTSQRLNTSVRFTFIDDDHAHDEVNEENDHASYIEFKLDQNELTQSVFLRIIDYSDIEDDQELQDLWGNLVETLKEIVGG